VKNCPAADIPVREVVSLAEGVEGTSVKNEGQK
jgi:hypothetical protein